MKLKTLLIGLMTLVISFQTYATTKTCHYTPLTSWAPPMPDRSTACIDMHCCPENPFYISLVPPEECLKILNERSDEGEISGSLVSKYRKCINFKFSEDYTYSDSKGKELYYTEFGMKVVKSSYSCGVNNYSHLDFGEWSTNVVVPHYEHGTREQPYNHIHGVFTPYPFNLKEISPFSDHYSGRWFASSKDGYNFIHAAIEETYPCRLKF